MFVQKKRPRARYTLFVELTEDEAERIPTEAHRLHAMMSHHSDLATQCPTLQRLLTAMLDEIRPPIMVPTFGARDC